MSEKTVDDHPPAVTRPNVPIAGRVDARTDKAPGGLRTDAVPPWLRRLGWSGWMVTGVVVGTGATIVAAGIALPYLSPVIFAVVLAAVLQPWVEWMCRQRIPRTAAVAIATLAVPVLAVALILVVWAAVRGESAEWTQTMQAAAERLRSGTGVDPLTPVVDVSQRREVLFGLAGTVISGAAAVVALAFGVLIAVYVLFFLLQDGSRFGTGIARHVSVPAAVTRTMLTDAGVRLRRYVVGTTAVAVLDAVVIGLAAVILRLPLVGVIALVTFVAAYVPYLGAWLSAIFAVMVALGSGGVDTALWMLVIVLITQNLLEGVVRPLAFGAALDMHPLAILAATMVGGILGGVMGVFIAPPLAAIALSWRKTLGQQRSTDEASAASDGA